MKKINCNLTNGHDNPLNLRTFTVKGGQWVTPPPFTIKQNKSVPLSAQGSGVAIRTETLYKSGKGSLIYFVFFVDGANNSFDYLVKPAENENVEVEVNGPIPVAGDVIDVNVKVNGHLM